MERSKTFNAAIEGANYHPLLKQTLWLILAAWVYTLSFVFNNYWSQYASYKSVTASFQKDVKRREKAFNNFVADTTELSKLAQHRYNENSLKSTERQPVQIFLYRATAATSPPAFWSTNAVLPLPEHVSTLPTGSLVQYGNGTYEFLKRTFGTGKQQIIVIGLIQLHESFFIENAKLKSHFPGFNGLGDKMELTQNTGPYTILGETGKPICWLKPLAIVPQPAVLFNWPTFIVEILATCFLVLFITRFSHALLWYNHGKHQWVGFVFFICALLLLRFGIGYFNTPINLPNKEWGNHLTEVSEKTNLQLFLLNGILGLWCSIFLMQNSKALKQILINQKETSKLLLAIVIAGLLIVLQFFIVVFFRELYISDNPPLDLANFFSFDINSLLAFGIIFLFSAVHFIIGRLLIRGIRWLVGQRTWIGLLGIALLGLVFLSASIGKSYLLSLMLSLMWLLAFFYVMNLPRHNMLKSNKTGVLVGWMFLYAVSLAFLLGLASSKRIQAQTNSLGKSLLLQNDRTSEYSLRIAVSNIRSVDWSEYFTNAYTSTRILHHIDSINEQYFSGYLSRYKTNVFLFDNEANSLSKISTQTFESLNTLYSKQGVATDFEGLHYFGESVDDFGYVSKSPIMNKETDTQVGWLFTLTRTVGFRQAVAPELFRQLQDFAVDLPQGYSYAWYKNGVLIDQYRNYPFPSLMPRQATQSTWENEKSGVYELWLNAGSNTVLALAAQHNFGFRFMSLMAYIFGAFLIAYALFSFLILLYRGKLFSQSFWRSYSLNLQTQIRATIVSILLVSFVIIAGITVAFFIKQYRSGNQDKLAKTVQVVATDIIRNLPEDYTNLPYTEKADLVKKLLYSSTQHVNVDANFYSTTGVLLASTQAILFDKGVISPMADPVAWSQLSNGQINRYIATEKIGNLSYTSIYQPLRTKNSQVFGYLQVPYFASQNELNQEISNFLVILLNIIAFVFLLSGGVAFWISGSITKSFDLIAQKMNRLRLSERNERIEWHRDDEIGRLVQHYNTMVDQLEISAQKMAKNEREMAWREMARQVAHEIKNPLTPMKLNLQFLQKAISENRSNVADITQRVAGNLVGQIDHLSKIAYDFSQFANLGDTSPELLDADDMLETVLQLYSMHENLTIERLNPKTNYWVMADKTQLNRLFTNLIQNAVEAMKPNTPLHIGIKTSMLADSFFMISIADDGQGIPPEIQTRIFAPNFTTKSGGTGLGLAICMAIVENAGGEIWFNTSHTGTTFFIKLPMVAV